jgi:hypothetical protein
MLSKIGLLFLTVLLLPDFSPAQGQRFGIAVRGNYTTASRLFVNPNSPDPVQRGQFFSLEKFLGAGAEIRYYIPETNLAVGLGVDYIRSTIGQSIRISTSRSVPVEDGYRVIPVEMTGYFMIPVSGQSFGVFMGGGVGGYFGRRLYTLGGTEAPTVRQGRGFGIHVLGGISYRFTGWFALSAEMKFRDLQFETSNQFTASRIIYNGTAITVGSAPFDARVHTDGVVFQLSTLVGF